MPRQGNGVFQQPANTAAVSGQAIASTAFNTLVTDLGSEITNSLDRNGRSAMAAALQMGNNKVTGAADPTAPQDMATKNYVDTTTATFFSTGDIKFTLKVTADAGWMLFNDGTIGNDTSGASLASTATAAALFTLIWNNISNTWAPIQDSTGVATTRGASAAADFTASKRMPLTRVCGRALGVAGIGGGLTTRALGQILGEETHLLSVAEMPSHTHPNALTDLQHSHLVGVYNGVGSTGSNGIQGTAQANNTNTPGGQALTGPTGISISNGSAGGGGAHNVMQPTTFLNCMVKL